MATYTFIGNANSQSVNWNDPTVWSGASGFPNSPTADVVFPEITKGGAIYTSFVTIASGQSYSADSVSLTDNQLAVDGTLSVANAVDVEAASVLEVSGALSAGSLTVGSATDPGHGQVQGSGQINIAGAVTNDATIVGSGLSVSAATLDNVGVLIAVSGDLTVTVNSGGFSNLSGSTVTGGTYIGQGGSGGGVLDLNVGAVITTDAANMQFTDGGDIQSFDAGSSQYVSLQTSLTTIAQNGTLTLTNQTFNSQGLTDDGVLTLADTNSGSTTFNAPLLTVGSQGSVNGVGTIGASISNSGTIIAGFMPGQVAAGAPSQPLPANNLLEITGSVSGTGLLEVGAPFRTVDGNSVNYMPATLQLDGADSDNVSFSSSSSNEPGGTLILNDLSGFTGSIVPGSGGDIVIADVNYSSVTGYSYSGNPSGGTLTIQEGGDTIALNFIGNLNRADFTLSAGPQALSSSPPSLEIAVNPNAPPPPPNPAPPAGTTAVMIMTQASSANYEIYDLGNNNVLAAYPLTNIASPWQVVGLGNFSGTDLSDMMLRNTSSGAFEIVDVSGNNAGSPIPIGNVGLEWTVSGFGDFSGQPNETDMLMRDSSDGDFEVYDIANNTVTSAALLGNVGLDWSVLGFGDFSGKANETDMLMRNGTTGNLELYDISNNQVTSATSLGGVGSEWQFAGAGDFSGRPGETDMLMRDINTGNFELYDFENGAITSAAALGNVGLNWTVAGFGDFSGHANETDMLLRDSNTGNFELYDISNSMVTSAAALGNVGLDWSVVGVGASSGPNAGASSSAGGAPQSMVSDQGLSSVLANSDPTGPSGTGYAGTIPSLQSLMTPATAPSGPQVLPSTFETSEATPVLGPNLLAHA
jgi:hypothetical protein